MGVGKALIAHTRSVAAEMGYRAILLCGDPDYYSKAGFVAAEQFNIRTSENKYIAALHVCPLWPDALAGVTGQYYEDEIYNINIAEAEEFDRSFPKKERHNGNSHAKSVLRKWLPCKKSTCSHQGSDRLRTSTIRPFYLFPGLLFLLSM